MNWYFQYTPGDMWDYDAAGTHILVDGEVAGQPRKLVTHSGRNGFFYALERTNGQPLLATPYVDTITWTKGIDQKTGLPIDYDPTKDIQVYSGQQAMTLTDRTKKLCPSWLGGNNYWSASYSRRTKLLYIPSASSCNQATFDPDAGRNADRTILGGVPKYIERNESDIVAVDPLNGEVKKKLHNHIQITARPSRRRVASSSRASSMDPLLVMTTSVLSSFGRSMLESASTRRQ
jgi:alcohol dehydrogenase (cytochrome c)